MTISKVVLGAVSLIGAGGIGLFGASEATKKTISDGLKERKIPELKDISFSWDIWTNMISKFLNASGDEEPKSKNFIDFKKTLEKNYVSGESLKDFCREKLKETYSTIFRVDEKLLDDVKSFCTINIENVGNGIFLEASKEKRENNEDSFKKNFSLIKNHDVERYGVLDKGLSEFSNEDKESSWEKLADWCFNSYKLSFVDTEDSLWVQVLKYCGDHTE